MRDVGNDADFYRAKARDCEQRAHDETMPSRQRQAYRQAAEMWRELAANVRIAQTVEYAANFSAEAGE